jgi:hypothetical protein
MRPRHPIVALLAALALVLALAATPASAAGARVFLLHLTGDKEATQTCAPPTVCGDPDAVGRMLLIVIPERDKVCFATAWRGIDGTVVAAHIHPGAVGVPGPVAVPLFEGPLEGTDRIADCVSANGRAADIVANPAGFYVNIHSTVFPPGAIRDQVR